MMPVTYNVGILVGPVLGGWLQDPVHTFPKAFGPGTRLGGPNGVPWMTKYPYALPNLITASLLFISVFLVLFALEEVSTRCLCKCQDAYGIKTHMERQHIPDYALRFSRSCIRFIKKLLRPRHSYEYSRVHHEDVDELELGQTPDAQSHKDTSKPGKVRAKLPFRRLFTRNVVCTLFTHGLNATHVGAFGNLWFLLLSTPRFDPVHPNPPQQRAQEFPIHFTGLVSQRGGDEGFANAHNTEVWACHQRR